ncbi:hypothetical protein U1Q18_020792, partial [Sarracenia purpurea var. burkii]
PFDPYPSEAIDVLVWHYSNDGNYNVKSGYFVELSSRSQWEGNSSEPKKMQIWKRIWSSEIPNKVKSL